MDRHDGENLTPEAVAEAHAADIKLQDKYDCKFITYWYDDDRDSVFCLVDAPDMSTVHKVHNEAHGFHHNEIMEVDQAIVKAFLGRVEDPAPMAGEVTIDSPFRAIMFTDLEGSTQMITEFGDKKSMALLRTHNAHACRTGDQTHRRRLHGLIHFSCKCSGMCHRNSKDDRQIQ
jgi:hypothetical protein